MIAMPGCSFVSTDNYYRYSLMSYDTGIFKMGQLCVSAGVKLGSPKKA